jgi:hypothetical protein|tara:strand:+ start:4260 stop:5288 length:1029 start_codon:yes stop_codon:yes gene_type:complete
MANKNVYQDYNNDALKHFGLDSDPFYGVITSSQVDDVLITQDKTTFNKVRDLLTDETIDGTKIQNYKRAFIMPGCSVTQDRLKAACKEHKVTITNDYEKADFIITNDDFYQKFTNGDKIKTTKLMYRLWNYEAFNGKDVPSSGIIKNHHNPVIWDDKWNDRGIRSYNCANPITLMDEWGITGLALNIAYLIDTSEIEVIDEENLLHASANQIDLTEDLVKEINTWVESHDDENIAVAAKIIPTINYKNKPHLMWELAQTVYSYTYKFNRDKDVKYWLEKSELSELYHSSAEDMIMKLEKEEKLNSESFRYLEKTVRKEISIHNRELYVFKVSVKPEYKKYLK